MTLSLTKKLMLGRLLTRSGDQAWDFAVPLVLLKIFPDQLRVAAIYYLLAKLGSVLFVGIGAFTYSQWLRRQRQV